MPIKKPGISGFVGVDGLEPPTPNTSAFSASNKGVISVQVPLLHADETPIKVMDKDKKGETHRGYYWVYQNSFDKIVLFDYREGRGREGSVEILKDFKGYLQTDGYVAYDVFSKRQGITLIHCMASRTCGIQ